ncbi:hypothetical protein LSAT2_032701, partial [Lamellibrachia satsuma]
MVAGQRLDDWAQNHQRISGSFKETTTPTCHCDLCPNSYSGLCSLGGFHSARLGAFNSARLGGFHSAR